MNKVENPAVKIPKRKGEEVRLFLLDKNMLRKDLKIKKQGKYLLFPIKKMDGDIPFPIVKENFELHKQKIKSYKDLLRNVDICTDKLPTSFDIIGDIILIKLPSELIKYREIIGNALLKTHPHIKAVYNIKPVSGELRIRKVEFLAGEHKSETVHREYGALFYLDITKIFYSPRLATERKRIASLVREGEIVLDMFTGVAPFPVLIARYGNPKKIYAIDKNREAIIFAKKNIKVNKAYDIVEVIHGDAKDIKEILGNIKVDRVIMNLPFSAYKFFSYTLQIIKSNAVIHYYDILCEDKLEKRKRELEYIASKHGFILHFDNIRRIKTYAPREFYIGMDITAYRYKADVA